MDRWYCKLGRFAESELRVEAFLDEIEAVCRKHDMSISHEDPEGSFLIEGLTQENVNWLRSAGDNRGAVAPVPRREASVPRRLPDGVPSDGAHSVFCKCSECRRGQR